jgi:hypothetical protein
MIMKKIFFENEGNQLPRHEVHDPYPRLLPAKNARIEAKSDMECRFGIRLATAMDGIRIAADKKGMSKQHSVSQILRVRPAWPRP